MKDADFTIGRLSDETGVNIETIRYYERIGLTPAPPRSDGGRRLYGSTFVRRLAFIRRGRELGFSLDEIRSLLGLQDDPPSCADVYRLATRHIAEIRSKIADLRRIERQITAAADGCSRGDGPNCPLIDELAGKRRRNKVP